MFKPVIDVVPEGELGVARVEHFAVTPGFWSHKEGVTPGKYAKLLVKGRLYMSDTSFEHRTNWWFAHHANGHVLVAGLGLGMVLTAILDKPEVTTVTVVEKYQDVIDLVAPHHSHPKLTIVCADIFEWYPPVGVKYDVVYFDIWPDLCTDDLKEMATLHRRFAKRVNRGNPKSWMGSWCHSDLLARRRQERKSGW